MRILQANDPPASDEEIAGWYEFGSGATLRSNMIMSADGAAVGPDGLSKSLAGPADGRLLSVLRALSDAVIVGAGTLRAERYRPIHARASLQAWRERHGLATHPRLVMITGTPKIDDSFRSLAQAPVRPLVICGRDTGALAEVAEVIELPDGDGGVDLRRAKEHLVERGLRRLHTEGGPNLLGDLLRQGLLDEYCLTLAPVVLGSGNPLRPVMGDLPPVGFTLAGVCSDAGFVFLRYRRTA